MKCSQCNDELVITPKLDGAGRSINPEIKHQSTGRILCKTAYRDLHYTPYQRLIIHIEQAKKFQQKST